MTIGIRSPTLVALLLLSTPLFAQEDTSTKNSFVTNSRLTLGTESNRSASVRLGDLDGDGDLDAVVANGRHWPGQNYIFLNQGRARFSVMRPLGSDRVTTYACELADLDGDGDLDIATGNDMARGRIFLNDGTGSFKQHSEFGEVSSVRSLTVADIDNDGDNDILATCRGRQNRIYLNDGDAGFEEGATFGTSNDSTIDVAVADINQDGHADLVLANRDGQPNRILLNDGKLGFSESKPFSRDVKKGNQRDSRATAVADLNSDGNLDWVIGNIGQRNAIFLGDGMGGVIKSIEFGQPNDRTYTLALADLDNDDDIDIIIGNAGQTNSVYFNNGQASEFREERFGLSSGATYGLSVGDINGDGLADIATANSDALNYIFLRRGKK